MRRISNKTITLNLDDAYDADHVLGPCPFGGQENSRHHALLGAASKLRHEGYEPEDAAVLLKDWLTRDPQPGEIEQVILKAWGDDGGSRITKSPKAPPADRGRVVNLYRRYGGYDSLLAFLQTDNVIKSTRTEDWLRRLYSERDLLCIGKSKKDTEIRPLEEWLSDLRWAGSRISILSRHSYHAFLTPAVFRAKVHRGDDGKKHGRCDENVSSRRYYVLECDIAETETKDGEIRPTFWTDTLHKERCTGFDLQAGVIRHLFENRFPIVSIVHSGGRSLHMWCSGKGFTDKQIKSWILDQGTLGVDTKAGVPRSQFFRLPNPDHPVRPQPLLYFNPEFINL